MSVRPSPPTKPAKSRRYFLRKAEADGLFSGERLREIDPARYEVIKALLGEGVVSQRMIAKIVGCSPNTIRAIARAEDGAIDALRVDLAERAAQIEAATLERIQEILDSDCDPDLRALAAILREVGQRADALAGRPSAVVELRAAAGPAALAVAADERRRRLQAIQAEAETTHFRTRDWSPRDSSGTEPGSVPEPAGEKRAADHQEPAT